MGKCFRERRFEIKVGMAFSSPMKISFINNSYALGKNMNANWEVYDMNSDAFRDKIVVLDEDGDEKELSIEALFDMKDKTYALLSSEQDGSDTFVMQVENTDEGQFLTGISDPSERNMILDAYEIAVDANPETEWVLYGKKHS